MFSRKIALLISFILGCFYFSITSLYAEVVEEILFKINEDIITKMDFEAQSKVIKKTYIAQSEKIPYNFEKEVISNMIIETLIRQEAVRQGIKVTDLDVSNHINSLVQVNNLGSVENLESYVLSQGMHWQYFFNNQKMSMYKENLLGRVITIRQPSQEETLTYYEKNKEKEFKISDKLPRVSIIYLQKDPAMTYSEILKLNALGKQIEKELERGSDFAELAQKYSEDFKSKGLDGDTGWRVEKEFSEEPELWQAIEKLRIGDVSPLLSGKDGFYLFKITDEKTSGYVPFERARRDIQLKLARLKRQEAYESKMKEIIREAVIKRKTERFGDLGLQ